MVFAGDVFGEEKEGSWGDGQVLRATQRRGWVPPGPWGSMEGKIDHQGRRGGKWVKGHMCMAMDGN